MRRWPEHLVNLWGVALALLVIPITWGGLALWFRGYFVGDADEVIRAWYGRCAFENPNIIPYSHLSQPGWTAILALTEGAGRLLGLPLTTASRWVTVACSWLCLRQVVAWVRAVGGGAMHAGAAALLLMLTPGFFLMSLTVYPSVALACVVALSLRLWADDRHVASAAAMGWAPLLRWEGALLVLLWAALLALKRRWRALLWAFAPYLLWIGLQAARYGNPWKPLAYRTTEAMGAWLLFNPSVGWDRLGPALANLAALWAPGVLVCGLGAALWGLVRRRDAWLDQPLPWAFGGLTLALLSIQHDWMVWALRVFTTPSVLGVLVVAGVASALPRRGGRVLLAVAGLCVAVSVGMTVRKVNETRVPQPGRFRVEPGFHMFVRPASGAEALDWLLQQEADWVVTNHLNANLLRADERCSLYGLPLRLGSPRMSLSREFVPTFGLPNGEGLVVFHTPPQGVEDCTPARAFPEAGIRVFRCRVP